ncbi:MAG TPA: FtsW/RodA/SpoVE family cell cycle protein, partial [Verrucomicrobiae bacterium]|nr:FtsW/RodA/SpoVE family cell cycle protein [Verrucomicrobiae bacterium]
MNPDAFNEKHSKLDKLQLMALFSLMVIGALFVYSATISNGVEAQKSWYAQTWFRQVIWYGLGLGAALALCAVSYHTLARWSFVFYWGMIVCLVAVLIPFIGKTHGWGARRWIDLPFYQFQPSEFAKVAFVLAGANFLSRPPEELRQGRIFWKGIGMIMLPF